MQEEARSQAQQECGNRPSLWSLARLMQLRFMRMQPLVQVRKSAVVPSSAHLRSDRPLQSTHAAAGILPNQREVEMALINFILTVATVGAGVLLFTIDIRKSGTLFGCNACQIKRWLDDTAAAASKSVKEAASKKLDSSPQKEAEGR